LHAQAQPMFDATADYLATRHSKMRSKRLFDIAVVLATAPVWLAIIALLCLLVRLSDPHARALYWQERTGRLGYRFKLAKIRTMCPDADAMLANLASVNELSGPDFKIRRSHHQNRIGLAPDASRRDAAAVQRPFWQYEPGWSPPDIDGTARAPPHLVARPPRCSPRSDRALATEAHRNPHFRRASSP
jgi:hypothetical protein